MSAQTTARPAPSRFATGRTVTFRLPQPLRKAVLVLHVASSVAWLGLSLGLLALAATGLTTSDPQLERSVYLGANVLGQILVGPISLTAFTTGVVLALGTKWGLVQHKWVLVKFVLTAVPVVLTFISLRPGLSALAASAASATDAELIAQAPTEDAINMVVAPSVATTMYLTSTILSVTKPWGRTPWGRRQTARNRT
jgi:hypothetical protein